MEGSKKIRRYAKQYASSFVYNVIYFITYFPTTNGRILLSLFLIFITAIFYLVGWKDPDWEWYAFLGALAGIDVAQFGVKRYTQRAENILNDDDVTESTDIEELSKKGQGSLSDEKG